MSQHGRAKKTLKKLYEPLFSSEDLVSKITQWHHTPSNDIR